MKTIESIRKVLDKVLSFVCIVLLAAMTVIVTYQVIVRYFIQKPSPVTEAMSKYMFIWMVLYASAYVFGLRGHMNIGFIINKMKPKNKIKVEMLSEFIIAIFALFVMLYGGFLQTSDQMGQLDAALQIPIGIIYSAVPISALFILFYFISNELRLYKELSEINNEKEVQV